MSLLIGAIVSFVVRLLAKISFVKNNPKLVASLISAAVVVIAAVCTKCGSITEALKQLADQIGSIATAVVTATATAVAVHEIVISPTMGPMNAGSSLTPGDRGPYNPLQGGR